MISKYKNVAVIYGGKGRNYAEALHKSILKISDEERYPICSKLIMETILTSELLSDVMELFRQSEFCVGFLTADDVVLSENQTYRLRQNVVFELGMALMQIGRERCILLSDFDSRAAGFELPSDMNSLEIRQFDPDDINKVIHDAIEKILQNSKISIVSETCSELIPQYDNLLTRETYYINHENLFLSKQARMVNGSSNYFQQILRQWYEECSSLYHYDEKCIYLLERLCFLPLFGCTQEVNTFMKKVADLAYDYKIWDINYYHHNVELLNFVRDLVQGVIEYSHIKTLKIPEKSTAFKKVLDNFLAQNIPEYDSCNPLILLVYYNYLGLTYLKLSKAQEAKVAFEQASQYESRVDMSMQIWGGFLYYNMARTCVLLGDLKNANTLFKKAIRIRERWLKVTSFYTKIRNALSFEYFLAKLSYLEMCDENGLLTKAEIQQEYALLEKEIDSYSEEDNSIETLIEIRKRLNKKRQDLTKE